MKKELDRTIKYAQGLGIKVHIKSRPRNHHLAEWVTDGSEITLFVGKSESYVSTTLNLIHELAHHMAFVYNKRKTCPYIEKVFTKAEEPKTLTKEERKVIWQVERQDSSWQEIIYNELNLRIPLYKLYLERDISNWSYKQFYLTGKFPTTAQFRTKRKKLKKELLCKLKNR